MIYVADFPPPRTYDYIANFSRRKSTIRVFEWTFLSHSGFPPENTVAGGHATC